MNLLSNTAVGLAGAVVIDANVLIAVCAREQDKLATAEAALADYTAKGWLFYAPGVILGEVLYILCGKLQSGLLNATAHREAIENLQDQMKAILPPPRGEASLIARAEEVRSGYGCSRSADGLYIALAEELAQAGAAELLTFDAGFANQIARNAPTVMVNLLPS
jgi:predicted nucleic acid-binding protein